MKDNLYERDFNLWIEKQIEIMKTGELKSLDIENMIEEMEAVGRNDFRSMRSQLIRLMLHLLKWQYQPNRRGVSWKISIKDSRAEIEDLLEDSPSLKNKLLNEYQKCYQRAKEKAEDETGLIDYPKDCLWDLDTILDNDFWP